MTDGAVKVSLALGTSAAGSVAGAVSDVMPRWLLLVCVVYVVLCGFVLLGLHVARDVRNFRAGK